MRRRGVEKVAWMFTFAAAAYNLVRIRNLRVQSSAAEAEVCENAEKRRTSARVTRTVSLRMAENHIEADRKAKLTPISHGISAACKGAVRSFSRT